MSPLAPAQVIGDRDLAALESFGATHPRCGTNRMRVVVLGAGYGGMTAALRLARRLKGCAGPGGMAELVLVDRHPYHLLKTRLHEAAVSGDEVAVGIPELLRDLNLRFECGEVEDIDLGRRRVITNTGEIAYDVLVIAMGAQSAYRGVPGLRENTLTLRTREDAVRLRSHLQMRFAEADQTDDPVERARLRRIVIAGGGFSGVELAAELADRVAGEVLLLQSGERLLASAGPLLARWAAAQLRRRGVRVETQSRLVRAEPGIAHIAEREPIAAGTLIWMGGVQVSDVLQRMGAPTGRLGRILVDETLQVVGAPGVYAIGDAALGTDPVSGKEVPLTARFAAHEGRYVGDAIAARLQDAWVRPYHPRVRGDAYNMERYLGLASLAFGRRGKGHASALARMLKRFPAIRHMLRMRRERAAWHLDYPLVERN
ncbi:MAG TPA: FAD-dependent oxidoreductase [Longimicrobiaceae bacterium]|nr:FAD-dependent oxidoreductase [Longimicrobiaceae bacterium]